MYNLLIICNLTLCNFEVCFKGTQVYLMGKLANLVGFINSNLYVVGQSDSADILLTDDNDIVSTK